MISDVNAPWYRYALNMSFARVLRLLAFFAGRVGFRAYGVKRVCCLRFRSRTFWGLRAFGVCKGSSANYFIVVMHSTGSC